MVRYVTNLLLLDTPSLWRNTLFAAPVWSDVAKMLSTCLDNLELYNLVRYTANIRGSCCSPRLSLIALFKKLYCRCLTKPGKGDIPSSIRHRSLAVVLRTPSKYFIALIYNFSTTWCTWYVRGDLCCGYMICPPCDLHCWYMICPRCDLYCGYMIYPPCDLHCGYMICPPCDLHCGYMICPPCDLYCGYMICPPCDLYCGYMICPPCDLYCGYICPPCDLHCGYMISPPCDLYCGCMICPPCDLYCGYVICPLCDLYCGYMICLPCDLYCGYVIYVHHVAYVVDI